MNRILFTYPHRNLFNFNPELIRNPFIELSEGLHGHLEVPIGIDSDIPQLPLALVNGLGVPVHVAPRCLAHLGGQLVGDVGDIAQPLPGEFGHSGRLLLDNGHLLLAAGPSLVQLVQGVVGPVLDPSLELTQPPQPPVPIGLEPVQALFGLLLGLGPGLDGPFLALLVLGHGEEVAVEGVLVHAHVLEELARPRGLVALVEGDVLADEVVDQEDDQQRGGLPGKPTPSTDPPAHLAQYGLEDIKCYINVMCYSGHRILWMFRQLQSTPLIPDGKL